MKKFFTSIFLSDEEEEDGVVVVELINGVNLE